MSTIRVTENHDCSYLNKTVTMSVNYLEVTTREAGRHFKRGTIHNCDCNSYDVCTLKDEYDRCPVYLSFPNPKII